MIHRGRELAMRQTDCGSQNTVSSLNHECGKYYRGFLRCDQPCQTSRILSKISLLITAKTGRHRVVYFEWLCNKLGIVIVNRIQNQPRPTKQARIIESLDNTCQCGYVVNAILSLIWTQRPISPIYCWVQIGITGGSPSAEFSPIYESKPYFQHLCPMIGRYRRLRQNTGSTLISKVFLFDRTG